MRLFGEINIRGTTVVVATHDLGADPPDGQARPDASSEAACAEAPPAAADPRSRRSSRDSRERSLQSDERASRSPLHGHQRSLPLRRGVVHRPERLAARPSMAVALIALWDSTCRGLLVLLSRATSARLAHDRGSGACRSS